MARESSTPELIDQSEPHRESPPPQSASREDGLAETVIEAAPKWWRIDLRELWRSRELIYFLALRDLKVRYQHTALGAVWAVLQPAVMTVIFTIFLGPMAGGGPGTPPYPVYVYTGFMAWNLFSAALTGASHSVIGAEAIITKIYFPRLVIPLAAVGGHLVDFAIACTGLAALMLYYHLPPTANLLLMPLWAVLTVLAGFGVGTLLAALNVKYRDFRHLQPFILQVWMFSTPSIFIQSGQPSAVMIFGSQGLYTGLRQLVIEANPMNALVALFRVTALGGPVPWDRLVLAAAVVALFVLGGCYYFRRVEDTFADII
jgi:lipopolysaccharide transport system permease protein